MSTEQTNKYLLYNKAFEKSLSHLQGQYESTCKSLYDIAKANNPCISFDTALNMDSSEGSSEPPEHMLSKAVAIAVIWDYVYKAIEGRPAAELVTGTPSDIAAKAAEYGANWTYALYDTVLVSKTAKYEHIRAYLRAIAPNMFTDERTNVIQAANIQHTGITAAYTMQEFTQLTKAKRDGPNDYTYTKATKKTTKKGTTTVIPAVKTHVTYTVENPEMSNGYTFDETDEAEIQRIWSYITPIAKLYIEAIDNLLRRIDIDSPTAQIFWVDDSGLVSGKRYLTIEQIIREAKKLDHNSRILPETKNEVVKMLERLCCIRAAIDYNDVIPYEGCGRNVVRDYLISFVYRDVIVKGKQTRVLVFNSVSVFGQYVQQLQQLTGRARVLSLPNAYLYNPNISSTNKTMILYRYLAEWVWSKTNSARYFKGIYELLGATDRKQQQRARRDIEAALNYYLTLSDCPFTSWKYWQSVEGDGIQLIRKKPNSKKEAQLTAQIEELQKRLKTVEQKTADFE